MKVILVANRTPARATLDLFTNKVLFKLDLEDVLIYISKSSKRIIKKRPTITAINADVPGITGLFGTTTVRLRVLYI